MQISSAALLAAQGQTAIRPQPAGPAFEPIAFTKAPAPAAASSISPATAQAKSAPAENAAPSAAAGGYVRPGTNLDIKI